MKTKNIIFLDPLITISFTLITSLGLLILASASMPLADNTYGQPFFFFSKQIVCLLIGLVLLVFMLYTPTERWQNNAELMLYINLFLLFLVLLVGVEVNGAKRWLPFPGFRLQASEVFKFALIIYMAKFIAVNGKTIPNHISVLLKPVLILAVSSVLLLLEPDFGATVVIMMTFIGMVFLAGVSYRVLLSLLITAIIALGLLAIFTPYRFQRLISFMHPWDYAYSSGYQLTQALISYGRGDWFGLGLGGSIQKLFFLPEAHTDFIFAIFAEELGLIGVVTLIALYLSIILRVIFYAVQAQSKDMQWHAFVLYGFAFYFAAQVFISIGVNLGILPTKGLTLPLVSYGRSSLIVNCGFIGLVLRCIVEIQDKSRVAKYRSIMGVDSAL